MKYVFLGIKGVLVTSSTEKKSKIENEKTVHLHSKEPIVFLHKTAVGVLSNFLDEIRPYHLVLSSSWKNDSVFGLSRLNRLFSEYGLPSIQSVTPNVDSSALYNRGKEILLWLEQNSVELDSNVIIIDSNVGQIRSLIPYRNIIDVSQGWSNAGIAKKHIDYWKRRNGIPV